MSSVLRQLLELRHQFQGLTRRRVVDVHSPEPPQDFIVARRRLTVEADSGPVGWRHEQPQLACIRIAGRTRQGWASASRKLVTLEPAQNVPRARDNLRRQAGEPCDVYPITPV